MGDYKSRFWFYINEHANAKITLKHPQTVLHCNVCYSRN